MFGEEPYGNYNRILLSSVLSGAHDHQDIFINPLLVLWPGLIISLTIGSFALFGNAVRDALEDGLGVPIVDHAVALHGRHGGL